MAEARDHDPGSSSLLDKLCPVRRTGGPGRVRSRMRDQALTRSGWKPAHFFTLSSTKRDAELLHDVHT